MQEALNVKLGALPDETLVYCGHEYAIQVSTCNNFPSFVTRLHDVILLVVLTITLKESSLTFSSGTGVPVGVDIL